MKKLILCILISMSLSAQAYDPKAVNFSNLIDNQMNGFRIVPSASSKQYGGKGVYNYSNSDPAFCFGSSIAGTDSTIRSGYQGQKSTVGTTPANSQVHGVSYNPTSDIIFAFGSVSPGVTGFILYGTNCTTWSTGTWSGVGFGRAGASSPSINVIVGDDGTGCAISYSIAGTTWTAATIASSGCAGSVGGLNNVVWSGTKFVATGQSIYATSADGINWTVGSLPAGTWKGLIWDNSKFITAKGVLDTQFATSTNGTTWAVNPTVYSFGGINSDSFIWNGKYYISGILTAGPKNFAYSTDSYKWKTVILPAGGLNGAASDGIRVIGVNAAPVTATDTFILSDALVIP